MAVSVGVKTRSSEKIVLPVDANRTTVVLAQEPAPPHITQTHADCTPTQFQLNKQLYSHAMHLTSFVIAV